MGEELEVLVSFFVEETVAFAIVLGVLQFSEFQDKVKRYGVYNENFKSFGFQKKKSINFKIILGGIVAIVRIFTLITYDYHLSVVASWVYGLHQRINTGNRFFFLM